MASREFRRGSRLADSFLPDFGVGGATTTTTTRPNEIFNLRGTSE
jgi:hypothetical protein